MTWTSIDDGLNNNPQTRPGTVSNPALGLWVRLCVFTAEQLRYPAFDGAFDMGTVRSLKGTVRQVAELESAGMIESALAAGRWMVVESPTLMKFTGGGSDLKGKRAAAGRAGGLASGRSRRSKIEANASKQNEANASGSLQATASREHEANASKQAEANPVKQTEASASKQTEATGHTYPLPCLTSPVAPSAPDAGPDPSAPGHAKPVTSLAEAEALARADPFAFAWDQYPSHTGSREQARSLWQAITGNNPAMPHVEASQLLGAVIGYAQATRRDGNRFTPSMRKWLENRQYTKWLPSMPNSTEWGGITRQWLQTHAISLIPDGSWTDSVEQTFWARVKSGEEPKTVAQRLVSEINERSQP